MQDIKFHAGIALALILCLMAIWFTGNIAAFGLALGMVGFGVAFVGGLTLFDRFC